MKENLHIQWDFKEQYIEKKISILLLMYFWACISYLRYFQHSAHCVYVQKGVIHIPEKPRRI
jgi:hypothetical protein